MTAEIIRQALDKAAHNSRDELQRYRGDRPDWAGTRLTRAVLLLVIMKEKQNERHKP